MDNVTHSLFGLCLARAGIAQRQGRAGTVMLVLASNLPDVDVLLSLTHGEAATWLRRTVTHSVLGVPVLAALLALAFWWRRREASYVGWLGLALVGCVGHVFLDLVNSYGVVPLAPFSWRRVELAWIFIIDLALLGLLVAPNVAERLGMRRETAHRTALALVLGYVALTAIGRARAGTLLEREIARRDLRPELHYVFPEPLGPHRWRGMALADGTWRAWLVNAWTGRVELGYETLTDADAPEVAAVRAAEPERVADILAFAKAPLWEVSEDRATVTLVDLRFRSIVLGPRRAPFAWTFEVRATGR